MYPDPKHWWMLSKIISKNFIFCGGLLEHKNICKNMGKNENFRENENAKRNFGKSERIFAFREDEKRVFRFNANIDYL
jgi:hypothetical protein